jgi:D-arginine dehydrogenase
MRSADVIVVGGGVAGLSVARALAEQRLRVLLLERGRALASEASGNNAAIFRPLEEHASSAALPRRSRQLLGAWFGPELFDPVGLALVSARGAAITALAAEAVTAEVAHERLDRAELWRRVPSLAGGEAQHALLLHEGGVLDVPALTSGLAAQARAFGAELRTEVAVRALVQRAGRIEGVTLTDGSALRAGRVIVTAGAWNAQLGRDSQLTLPVTPLRRHLLQLTAAAGLAPTEPVVWRLEDEVYYRRTGEAVLASPCDEVEAEAGDVARDETVVTDLHSKLLRLAPVLANASVVRAWACLRTFATDRELVVGEDPRAQGLYWFAGLGGRGMSVAPAAAECLANIVLGARVPQEIEAASPARLLSATKLG